ncbi:hypothetical protein [Parabacteroides distasonis]|uniref:hypothetical protein n=1 Tax=Parabacteroides distasonis TaxID=823 RepID=UPI0022E92D40|nr:hypothetical protein [Parabacteroides distasonis]
MKDKREKEEVPSGIRLMLLLKERLVEIMDRERANQNSIHLYCTGPYFAYPFPIVMVSVMDRSLRSYARKHILRRDESDYKLLTVPGFSLADYREWHAGEVEGLPLLSERV